MADNKASVNPPFVIAVTGGIASGKTTVCELFYEIFQVETIDTDQLAKEAVSPGSKCLKEIVSVFGQEILDTTKNLNRPLMRKIIFQNPTRKKQLENIVHPEVKRLITKKLDAVSGKYCLLGIPLLHQKNQDSRIDRILVIDCDEKTQIQRTMVRDKLKEEDVLKIISSQSQRKERLTLADDLITNKGSKSELKKDIIRLNELYEKLSKKK